MRETKIKIKVMSLYMDDSGTRQPDRNPGRRPAHGNDWFGLGGVLIKEENEEEVRQLYRQFCEHWKISVPLHSAEIRRRSGGFAWVGTLVQSKQDEFYEDLYQLMARSSVIGTCCVIDRPGYNDRYRERYGRQRWNLCKTAFAICVERAAKYARREGFKLKVYIERCDKETDKRMQEYYTMLRSQGMPFSADSSGKYAPLTPLELRETLYDFQRKYKSSSLIQFADLYLWPMCIGGYDNNNRTYKRLKSDGKLIDCLLPEEELPALGIKYSCWELVQAREDEKNQSPADSGLQGSHHTVTS
jgi:hypothetical protein